MRVTVFGGANPKPGEAAYQEAFDLGAQLGRTGCTVLTGGYIGTMEAVSRGAAENNAHVIGVTCDDIERWRKVCANVWVMEEWRCPTLRERLFKLIDGCDSAIALPGGAGTLTEISLTWNLMIVESIPKKPLILVGSGWQDVFNQMFSAMDGYVTARDRSLLSFVPDVTAAIKLLGDGINNGR